MSVSEKLKDIYQKFVTQAQPSESDAEHAKWLQDRKEKESRDAREYDESVKKWREETDVREADLAHKMKLLSEAVTVALACLKSENTSPNRRLVLDLVRPYRGAGEFMTPHYFANQPMNPVDPFSSLWRYSPPRDSTYHRQWSALFKTLFEAVKTLQAAYGPLFAEWTVLSEVCDGDVTEIIATRPAGGGTIQKHIRTADSTTSFSTVFVPYRSGKTFPIGMSI